MKKNWIKLFQHDMAYGDVKDLTKRTTSDKILRDKASDVRYHDMMDIKEVLLQWFIIFLIKNFWWNN